MYPRNAASPEPVAIGAVVQISDGAVQTSGCTVRIKPIGVAEGDGAGTTAYSTDGIVLYTPTQAETNYTSFILIAKKTGCIPACVTVVTTASSVPGRTMPADGSITAAVIATDAIDADAIKADAVTEIQAGLATPTNITAATGITLAAVTHTGAVIPTVTTVTNGLDAAGVRTAIGLTNANLDTQLADLPTVSEFEARTILSADYFVVGDYTTPPSASTVADEVQTRTIARVTLVDTCTTNTDMRGTDGANTTTPPTVSQVADEVQTRTIARVTLVDTTTANTDMRGTDNALLASNYTSPPSASTISSQVASDLAVAHGAGSWTTATGFSTLSQADIRTAVGLSNANLDTQISGIQSDTDNIQTRLPAALESGRIAAALDSAARVKLDAVQPDYAPALAATALSTAVWTGTIAGRIDAAISSRLATSGYTSPPTTGAIADAVLNESILDHRNVANSLAKFIWQIRQANLTIDGTVSNAITPTTLTFASNISATTSAYAHAVLLFTTGPLAGENSPILTYNNTNGVFLLEEPLTAAPSDGDEFVVIAGSHVHSVADIQSGLATAAALAAAKTILDKVDSGLVVDGAVYQFTANMLELGPSGGGGGDATLAKQDEILAAIQGVDVIQVASPNVSGNLVLTQGDNYDGVANPRAQWNVTVDYTDGWSVRLTIRDKDDALIYTTTGTVVSATVVAVTIAAPTGLPMTGCPGQWQGKFDVELTKAGSKKTIALGACYINEDQTR